MFVIYPGLRHMYHGLLHTHSLSTSVADGLHSSGEYNSVIPLAEAAFDPLICIIDVLGKSSQSYFSLSS